VRILYGVCGEGMGHAQRSLVVADHLAHQGHNLRFVCARGRAFDAIAARYPDRVYEVAGLETVMFGNRVDPALTIAYNAVKQWALSPWCHLSLAARIAPPPDVVISDFEPFTARYASALSLPLLAVDNIAFLTRCELPPRMAPGALMRLAVDHMVPGADHYFVTTIAWAPISKVRTTLHAPIVRSEVLAERRNVRDGDHLTCYFNDKADARERVRELSQIGVDVHLWGIDRELSSGRVTCMGHDPLGFPRDLATSAAVVGGAGFTLLSEAIALGKPVLAVPFAGQGEQLSNARFVEALGIGRSGEAMTPELVRNFLRALPRYRRELAAGTPHDDNRELLSALDRTIGAAA
jgi:uncharacterized protein (TIGR00661 family)